MFLRRQYMVWAFISTLLCGCGSGDRGPERAVVSGTVTYNGKSIPTGEIRFMPVATSPVPTAGAVIKDGQYKMDGKGGVPVGTHKIEIEAYRQGSQEPGNPPSPLGVARGFRHQYLPKKYNENTQLEITIQPGSPPITQDFNLTD